MKLIYQQMLAFVIVILSTLIVLGIIFIQFSTSMVYRNKWAELAGYADSLYKQSMVLNKNGDVQQVRMDGVEYNENLLDGQRVRFTIYSKTVVAYPFQDISKITPEQIKLLKEGRFLTGKTEITQNNKKIVMTNIMKPYFNKKHQLIVVISVSSPMFKISKDIATIRNNLLIAFAIAIVFAIIAAYILSRYLTERIRKIRVAAHEVSNGNFDVKLASNHRDEIDKLSDDFNNMTSSLLESQAEIQRQEERRKEFMADAAHEMRTPLTTINGLLEGLRYDAIPEDSREESIILMQKETKRLIRLVNDNLDYERIRMHTVVLDRREIKVDEVVEQIIVQLTEKIEAADDKVEVDIASTTKVFADYDRFVQMLFNIIQNAVQFTEHGTIKVSARNLSAATEIKITDTGIGMNEEQLKNIWERYYKADSSRQVKGESGLGMPIVQQLVHAHGGSIDVISQPQVGTTFTIKLPNKETAPNIIKSSN